MLVEEEEEEASYRDQGVRKGRLTLTTNGFGDGGADDAAHDAEDTKYEDADTPATGATAASRHSVPSDDTMIGVELARTTARAARR